MMASSSACSFELFQILIIALAILSIHGFYCYIYDENRNLSSLKVADSIEVCGAYCIMEKASSCAMFLYCPQSNQNKCTTFTRYQDCDIATESDFWECGIFSKVHLSFFFLVLNTVMIQMKHDNNQINFENIHLISDCVR